jgi:hypothetical protein
MKISKTGNSLTVNETKFEIASNKKLYEERSSYDIGKHSFFWWEYFGAFTKK